MFYVELCRSILYCCTENFGFTVCVFRSSGSTWSLNGTLVNHEHLFSMKISADEKFLLAAVMSGYKTWNLLTNEMLHLQLPEGISNIPPRGLNTAIVAFTRNNQYVCAGVRSILYVWELKSGELVRTVDVHFRRVLCMVAVTSHGANKIATASLDRTVKVLNMENTLQQSHVIDRQHQAVEDMVISAGIVVTRSRTYVGLWKLRTGRMIAELPDGGSCGVITHVDATTNGKYLVAVDTEQLLIWRRRTLQAVCKIPSRDVLQLLVVESEFALILKGESGRADTVQDGVCCGVSIGRGQVMFEFNYRYMMHRPASLTKDALFLVLLTAKETTASLVHFLSVYHSSTGDLIYRTKTRLQLGLCSCVVALPNKECKVGLVFHRECTVWDVAHRRSLGVIPRWTGVCTRNGKLGLDAPDTGGVELFDMDNGQTTLTLIPRVAEGVHHVRALFSRDDKYVFYYHPGWQNVRVFRIQDGKMLADYKVHTSVMVMRATDFSVVLGMADGSLNILALADPDNKYSLEHLKSLPSRKITFDSAAI